MVAKFISNKLKDFVRRKNTTKCVSSIGPSLLKFLPTFKQIILKNQTKNKIKITSLSQPQTNINIYIYTQTIFFKVEKKREKKRGRERGIEGIGVEDLVGCGEDLDELERTPLPLHLHLHHTLNPILLLQDLHLSLSFH